MIPAQAKMFLDFIRATEVGTPYPEAYDVVYGHNQGRLTKPITKMTIVELIENQRGFSQSFGSSASGAYQFMRNTLTELKNQFNLTDSALFDGELQDFLGYKLLERRGYHAFVNETMTMVKFAENLAKEWASFPVLANTRGAHRNVVRGQSYYAGDGLNEALVRPEQIEALLARVLSKVESSASPRCDFTVILARLRAFFIRR